MWHGFPALLLTTRGRKSGKLRRTALIYGRDGKDYLLVASNGGSPDHPMWYLNLVKNPEVEIQVGAEKITARARTATAAEKPRLWKVMVEIFPRYDLYQEKAGREIPWSSWSRSDRANPDQRVNPPAAAGPAGPDRDDLPPCLYPAALPETGGGDPGLCPHLPNPAGPGRVSFCRRDG